MAREPESPRPQGAGVTTTGPRRWVVRGIAALAVFAAGAGCAWASFTVLEPAHDPLVATAESFATVQSGEVGAVLSLNAVAEWKRSPLGANRASGVVTTVHVTAGTEVSTGSSLYSVDLRPVVVAQGDVPQFRDIALGTEGPDVRQLQQMLAELGFYSFAPDGKSGPATVASIKRWQASHDAAQTGVVTAGDIVFVPELPARIALDAQLGRVGASLSGGEEMLFVLPSAPELTLPVTDAQAAMMPPGARVKLTSPGGHEWVALVGEQVKDEKSDTAVMTLVGAAGASICGEQCAEVPVGAPSFLPAAVVLTEPATGLVVPASALVTDARGVTAVIDDHGTRIPVEVGASAKGMAIVSGVNEGTRVRVPVAGEAAG
jgi:peptidoglycan hydrolase-like protein with peptidoglycan-binding domain